MAMTANKGIFNLSDAKGETNGRGGGLRHMVSGFGRRYFVAEVIPQQLYQTINPIVAPNPISFGADSGSYESNEE